MLTYCHSFKKMQQGIEDMKRYDDFIQTNIWVEDGTIPVKHAYNDYSMESHSMEDTLNCCFEGNEELMCEY